MFTNETYNMELFWLDTYIYYTNDSTSINNTISSLKYDFYLIGRRIL